METAPQPPARPFVGRAAELAQLDAGLNQALAGRGGLFLISGEPGIGKTRLAAELGRRASERGARVHWGRCWDDGGAPVYWPWTQVLRACAPSTPSAELADDDLAPLLREPDAGRSGAREDAAGADRRFRLFEATALFLRRAAAEQPLVLLFDDMHAADESSLLLLRFCATELASAALLIVCTYREAEVRLQRALGARFAELARAGERLALRGWETAQVGEFLGALPAPLVNDAHVAAIREITEGNPFFVDEIRRELAAGRLVPAALLEGASVPVPDGVRETVRRRLAALPAEAVPLLEVAAVIGREFDTALLGAVLTRRNEGGAPPDDMVGQLDYAVRAGMLTEQPGRVGHYAFAHALIRETLRNDVPAGQRMAAHRIVGEVLESRAGERGHGAAEIAHHFVLAAAAGGAQKAVHYSRLAADEAFGRFAYEAAAAHYQLALDALQFESGQELLRCEILLAIGLAEHLAGRLPAAGELFRRAATLARRIRAAPLEARAALGYGRIGESGTVDHTLVELLEGALTALGEESDELRARLLARLAMALYFSTAPTDRPRYEQLSRNALAMARRAGDTTALGAALVARHFVLWGPQGSAERMSLSAELATLAEESGHRELALEAHLWRAIDLLERGDGVGFRAAAEALRRGAEAGNLPNYRWHAEVLRATWALACGDLAAGADAAERARELGERYHIRRAAQFFGAQMFVLRRQQGRLAELEPGLRAYAEQFTALPVWRCALAAALCESGRLDEAAQVFAAVMASDPHTWPCDGNWLPSLALLATACAALGDRAAALPLRQLLAPHAGTFVVIFDGAMVHEPVDHFLGLLADTLGEPAEAVDCLERAIALCDALGAPGLRERSQQALARLGQATSRPSPPPAQLAAAARVFRCDGDYWTIAFDGVETRLKHSRGLFYLASLLGRPGEDLHAVELASLSPDAVVRAPDPSSDLTRRHRGGLDVDAPLIDAPAKLAYRQRLRDLQADLATAEDDNDLGRAEVLRAEMQAIADELSRTLGLGGRSRQAPSDAERARIAVTKAILFAIRAIGRHNPALQRFLRRTIRTGRFCGYHPNPEEKGEWEIGSS